MNKILLLLPALFFNIAVAHTQPQIASGSTLNKNSALNKDSAKWTVPMNPAWKWKIASENASPELWAVEWVPEGVKPEDATRVTALQLIRNRLGGEVIDDAVSAMIRLHRSACPKDYVVSETKLLDIVGFPDAAAREVVVGCLVFTSEQAQVKKGMGEVTSFLFVRKAGVMVIAQYSIRSGKGFTKKDFAPNTPNAIELNDAAVRLRQIKGVL